ncbi:olfactory receptor 5AR1-like [Rhinophrynus dorsalis]
MCKTSSQNHSGVTEFTIQGFSDIEDLQVPLFIIFLVIFLIILFGNMTVVITIILDSHLHTPMYVFLCNLSLLDISYTSTVLPKLLVMLFTQHKSISFTGCMIQLHFFLSFACTEFFLFAVMAYDRFVAICHPLHYNLIMGLKQCARFITAVWLTGLLDPIGHTIFISNLCFCSSHNIDHFFCDLTPLLKLSCSDTSSIEILTYIDGTLLCLSTFVPTLISYVFIICSILKIQSSEGRHKAFSTCASHLTCVIIFYGTIISLYVRPTSMYSPKQDKFFALLYIILIPLLNPIIYTLKNKDIKNALRKLEKKKMIFQF